MLFYVLLILIQSQLEQTKTLAFFYSKKRMIMFSDPEENQKLSKSPKSQEINGD